jgi:acyl transferase domain-containing protein/NADP-dependent 3-hydroxy acid dehydrogenase YdfG
MTRESPPPIAVVGIGCRLPGAHGPEELWRNLCAGRWSITPITPERAEMGLFDAGVVAELAGCKGGFLPDVDKFEPAFFGVAPRAASRMDPQQRLLLETVWEALEDAGLPPCDIAGTATGVFVGQATADYRDLQGGDRLVDPHGALSGIRAMMSGFVSHTFDLHGPSVSVDSACSSSLLAVHHACLSLRRGESDLAIVGGVNLNLSPENFLGLSRYGMFAADGKCKFGDESANGFVRAEGASVVVLKTLDRALVDDDRVYAVILGSATNNDGRSGGYLGRPSALCQAEVIRAALDDAGVAAAEIDYIEAHGTGTPVGDVVELEALGAVVGHGRPADQPCLVGSVKTNIGHTEAAAGVTGLVKTVLSLYHGLLPASLHLDHPNPAIDWAGLPVRIPTELTPLPARGRPGLAGVNSFGITGTNAHVVLSQVDHRVAADQTDRTDQTGARLLTLSGHSDAALRDVARSYVEYLAGTGREVPLRDVCYSAARRQHQASRLAVVGSSHEEMVTGLGAYLAGKPHRGVVSRAEVADHAPRIAFVFPGQGSQWAGMGRELLASAPVFRSALRLCDDAVRAEAGWSVLDRIARGTDLGDAVEYVQPTLWAVQVSLAALWRSWGVEPDLVIGHSMGEIAAATVAGALTLRDAAAVICRRSRLASRSTGRGAMASVALSVDETADAITAWADRVSIAVVNSPHSTVISGEPGAVTEILGELGERDVYCRRIDVAFAAHSPLVDHLAGDLRTALADLAARPGKVAIHSTVFDEIMDGSTLDAEYWVRNFREPVLFSSATHSVLRMGPTIFVEISPHPILVPAVDECVATYGLDGTALPSLYRDRPELATMLTSLGALHNAGCPIDLPPLYGPTARLVSLTSYRWQRQRYWLAAKQAGTASRHPLLGPPVPVPGPERVWSGPLDMARNQYLNSHRVQGLVTFPGTGFCEVTVAAAREIAGDRPVVLSGVRMHRLLLLRDGQTPTLRVRLVPEHDTTWHAEVASHPEGDPEDNGGAWTVHGTTHVQVGDHVPNPGPSLDELRARCRDHLTGAEAYARITTGGNQWHDHFRGIAEMWRGDGEGLARISTPASLRSGLPAFHFHPALLDSCGQAMVAAADDVHGTLVLGHIGEVRLYGRLGGDDVWSHARLRESSRHGDRLTGDVRVFDADGDCLLELLDMVFQDPDEIVDLDDWLYEVQWERSHATPDSVPSDGTWLLVGEGTDGLPGVRVDPADFPSSLTEHSPTGVVYAGEDPYEVVRLLEGLTIHPARLWLVTRTAQVVPTVDTDVSPMGATVWGLGRVLMTEHPELRPVLIDVGLDVPVAALARELTACDGEDQVALRGDDRYVARMDHYRRPSRARTVPPEYLAAYYAMRGLKPGERVLVTDTTSPVGAAAIRIARWRQAEDCTDQADLVVNTVPGSAVEKVARYGRYADVAPSQPVAIPPTVTYQPVDPTDLGDLTDEVLAGVAAGDLPPVPGAAAGAPVRADATYLVTGGLGGIGRKIVDWLVAGGATHIVLTGRSTRRPPRIPGVRVRYAAVDVADPDAMRDVLRDVRDWPAVRGVFHTAGVVEFGLAAELDAATLDAVLRPKVRGSLVLDRLFQGVDLDCFVLFSSLACLLSFPMVSGYAAANAFLDALAYQRRLRGEVALSVNWSVWTSVGMDERAQRDALPSLPEGISGFNAQHGLEALTRLLDDDATNVAVFHADWPTLVAAHPQAARAPLMRRLAPPPAATHAPVRLDGPEEVTRYLVEQLAALLEMPPEELNVRKPLSQVGISSLVAVELRNRVSSELGVALPVVKLLGGYSLAELVESVVQAGTASP